MSEVISRDVIVAAAEKLLGATPEGSEVILFGSHARGEAHRDSDVDFLVVEPTVAGRLKEAARLMRVLRPMRLPVDVIVADRQTFTQWKSVPSSVYHEALRDGQTFCRSANPDPR